MAMRRRDSEVLGKVPAGATHWSVRRKSAYAWDWCTYAHRDGIARQEFPVSELSVDAIRDRWGSGTYRVMFIALGNGVRQVHGNGKIFELTATPGGGTPRPAGRALVDAPAPEAHDEMVRVLLDAARGKQSATELYETLAVPMGMGLSALFTGQDRILERLDTLERRLMALERRAAAPDAAEAGNATRLDRLLDRLESLEGHLVRSPAPPRRNSPGGGRRTPR
jgi:hypothetical protein